MKADLDTIREQLATVAKLRRLFEQWRSDFDGCKKSPWELRSDFVRLSKLCAESLKLMPGMVHLGWFDDPVLSHLTHVVIYNAGVCDAVKRHGVGQSDPLASWLKAALALDPEATFAPPEPSNCDQGDQAGERPPSEDAGAATAEWSRLIVHLFKAMKYAQITPNRYEETITETVVAGGDDTRPELFDEIEALLQELGKLYDSWLQQPHAGKWNEAWRRVGEGHSPSKGVSLAKRASESLKQAAALVKTAAASDRGGDLLRAQWELYSRPPANRASVEAIRDSFDSAIQHIGSNIEALDRATYWGPEEWSQYSDAIAKDLGKADAILLHIEMAMSSAVPGAGLIKPEESDLAILRAMKSHGAMPRGTQCAPREAIAKAIGKRNNSNLRARLSKLVKNRLIETVGRKGYRLTSDGEAVLVDAAKPA